jgi:hypothetical protein
MLMKKHKIVVHEGVGKLQSASTLEVTLGDRTTVIEGKLMQFMFRNPHSFVHVEAPDENGTMQRWAVEWGGAGQLSGQGVTNQTLRVGDVVSITGNPGRDPADHRLRMQYLRRPADGFEWGRNPGETFN